MKKQNKTKYIKAFSQEKADSLKELGFTYLFEKQGVYWFENDEKLIKFSEANILNDTQTSNTMNF